MKTKKAEKATPKDKIEEMHSTSSTSDKGKEIKKSKSTPKKK